MNQEAPEAIDVDRLSKLSGIPKSTLNKLRATPEESPPFFRLGRRCYYPLAAYREWAATRTQGGGNV